MTDSLLLAQGEECPEAKTANVYEGYDIPQGYAEAAPLIKSRLAAALG